MAGEVLSDQTRQVVERWRSEMTSRASQTSPGTPALSKEIHFPGYLAASNRRFEQWILDTCLRPYDRDWLNYQQEIALRHTSIKKNLTDGVQSTPYVPLREHSCLHRRHKRDNQTLSRRQGPLPGGRRKDASGLV